MVHDKNTQLKLLKEFAPPNTDVIFKDLEDAVTLLSTIFTPNLCLIEKLGKLKKDKEINPYVIVVSGGHKTKAKALTWLLKRWQGKNIVDGLVTSYDIIKDLEKTDLS